jgi:hypothetical protein
MDATSASESPAAMAAVLVLLLAAGAVGLPVLGGYVRAVAAMQREFASRSSSEGYYTKLPNESWVDVEEGKKQQPPQPNGTGNGGGGSSDPNAPPPLTFRQLLAILKPYFWPSTRLPSWRMNRVRCVSTWVFVTG